VKSPFLVGQYITRLPEPMLSPEISTQLHYEMSPRTRIQWRKRGGNYSGCQNWRFCAQKRGAKVLHSLL